jgi:DNA-binding IclR family transcriptional regulator
MNQSILKAFDILDLFTEKETEWSLVEISKRLHMPKPTVYRILQTLESRGYVKKEKYSEYDIRYRLGLKLLELGNLAAEQLELRKIALPYMKSLRDEIDEVIHLVILDGDEAIYIEKVEGLKALRLVTRIGKREPLHVGSGPKLLLSFQSDAFINRYVDGMSANTINKRGIWHKRDLLEEIEEIRQNGYSVSIGEQDPDTIGVSYPIFDYTGHLAAALAVSGPAIRFFGERGQMIQEKTQQTAEQISKALGWTLYTSNNGQGK